MHLFLPIVFGLVGLAVGSFLNVVIWRLPRGENLSRPRSHCPGCGALIRWFDNIPVVAWLALRGRCRACGIRISARYPLVELLTGVLFVLAAVQYGHHVPTAVYVAVGLAALVAISFIDLDHKIIPDAISKPGMAVMIAFAPAVLLHPGDWIRQLASSPALNAWLHAGAGALAGALIIYAVRILGYVVFRKEAMGLGDVKLLGFIGAMVGPLFALYAFLLGCVSGAVIGGMMALAALVRSLPITLHVRGKDFDTGFERARIRDDRLEVRTDIEAEEGDEVQLEMLLSAASILEDEDAHIAARGRIQSAAGGRWQIEVLDLSEDDAERLDLWGRSWRYIPFGPFLAIGGALALLYGDQVRWFLTEWYPRWVQDQLGG